MKNTFKVLWVAGILSVFGSLASCNLIGSNNDITGTWVGSFAKRDITVEITKTRWSLSVAGENYTDAGTYVREGNTGIMQSTVNNFEVGTAVLINNYTINFTLNQRTMAPGTHTLTRQYTEGDLVAMPINDGKGLEISKYTGSGTEVRIPPRIQRLPVTGIGRFVFNEKNLTSVTIPNSVTSIDTGAFYKNQLASVIIPNSVTSIELGAFSDNCLTSVTLPKSVASIGNYAFSSNQLTSVTIPNSVTEIGDGVFDENQLTSVTIPNSVTSIGNYAFFKNKLTNVTISNSVTDIGDCAFTGNQLTSITIPNSVISIGEWAFAGNQLTSVTIPNSVTNIGEGAFAQNQLTSITIPNSVTSFGVGVFAWNQLTSVTIPDSLTHIEGAPFYACPGLAVINVAPGNQNFSSVDGVLYDKNMTTLVQWPAGKTDSVIIPNSVIVIGREAFQECGLSSITIPNSVTSIGHYAFYRNRLTSIAIPNGVKSIGEEAFTENQLTRITIGANVTLTTGDNPSFGSGFETVYSNYRRAAGTYTRPNTDSTRWTRN